MAETPESGGPTPDDTLPVSTPPPEPAAAPPPEPESSDAAAEAEASNAADTGATNTGTPEAAAEPTEQPTAAAEPTGEPDAAAEPTEEPEAAAEPTPAPAPPELLESFDAFDLPQTLRHAVAAIGWDRPMPVQAATFRPLMEGRDVMVQSQTGSGKTGAFCVPWLASRFEPGAASETGVQLLVVLPTRELAKQVCGELQRLSAETPLRALPIYGGTAMQPQLAALAEGVHAAVGTPGRLLDHIRRRSLDLSRVRTAVLDECDEMLSMGFLEDIRALLEACPQERQTCLFSATVPADIERIARRYMRDPEVIKLSGDQVAAAEIQHAYYSVSGALKTRDLLDVIVIEEPTTALVFCNTREETNLVASVLRREGYAVEPLSSDLAQRQREHVMAKMRSGQIRFLVATDVAARGIDITHISHVINYSFPEAPDVYIHRTGRTARAGRQGVALSIVAPHEIGSFYSLKLHHPSIKFEERSLPPAEELARQRSETQLDQISQMFPNLVSPEWTLLARNLAADPRGERVVAQLLQQALTKGPRERRQEEPRLPRERARPDRRPRRERHPDRSDDSARERSPERKRRRRRRGGDEPPAEVDRPAADAADRTPQEPAEEPRARVEVGAAEAAEPGREAQGEQQAAPEDAERTGRRRRRRRRRKPRAAGEDAEATAAPSQDAREAAATEMDADASSEMEPAADQDVRESEAESEKTVDAEEDRPRADRPTPVSEGGRRRKRRRRRRRGEPAQVVPTVPHVPQDQIIIDIEASELEVVREEFGEIDELDDLTLKARRRAVIDVLQDEMELEDVSQDDETAEDEDSDESEDELHAESPEAAQETASGSEGAEASGEGETAEATASGQPGTAEERTPAPRKKRRRRRKKKRREAVPTPELTAPPHKDFWEVWAERFSFRDFEDAAYGAADPVDESGEASADEEWDTSGEENEDAFVAVMLNIGRTHGMKAAHVRDLLRNQVGLAGRAVRDLTVRDATTVFRIHPQRVAKARELLGRCEEAGITIELTPVEEVEDADDTAEVSETAPQEQAPDAAGAEGRETEEDAHPEEPSAAVDTPTPADEVPATVE